MSVIPSDGALVLTFALVVPFKNENLYAEHSLNGKTSIVATVPDLIAVLDAQNGEALGTPDYKYGLRVLVLGVTGAPQWSDTERGLALGDLRAFGCVRAGAWRSRMTDLARLPSASTTCRTSPSESMSSPAP